MTRVLLRRVMSTLLAMSSASFAHIAMRDAAIASPNTTAVFPIVSAYAGTGVSGERDGFARDAQFMTPRGLAVAADGTIYVSDYSAQRIRRIDRAGNVTTFAGRERPAVTREYHRGGYADGPAAHASFDGPIGMAIAPDGALIVADSRNHCLRRIARGIVTTMVGSPSRAKAVDGPPGVGSLHAPYGVAYARDGTLYVADFGAGLRAVDSAGAVTTLDNGGDYTSVDVRETANDTVVVAFGDGGITLLHRPSNRRERIDGYDESHIQGRQRLGYPHTGIVLDDGTLVFTDIRSQTIREVHVGGANGLETSTRIVAGNSSNDSANDGASAIDRIGLDARFSTPFAVARRPGGGYAITDGVSHRVRIMSDFDHRWADRPLPTTRAPGEYRIAYVGRSFAWCDTDWAHSIEGVFESRLAREQAALGLVGQVEVYPFVYDDVTAGPLASLARERFVAPFAVDAVVLSLDSSIALRYLPNADASQDAGRLDREIAIWRPQLVADLTSLAQTLRDAHVPLLAIVTPVASDYSATEAAAQTLPNELSFDRSGTSEVFDAVRAAIPDAVDATPKFDAAGVDGLAPLYQSYAGRFAPLGRRRVADFAFEEFTRRRPWLR